MPTLRRSGEAAALGGGTHGGVRLEKGLPRELGQRRPSAPTLTPPSCASIPPRPASRRSTSSAGARIPRSTWPGEVGAAAAGHGAVVAEELERVVERRRARVAAHAQRLEHAGGRQRQRRGAPAGRMRERVRDRGGCRHDRRLAEALGADVRQVAVGLVRRSRRRSPARRRSSAPCSRRECPLTGVAGRRVDDELLRERVADPLEHAALDLARGAERVHDPADVVHGDDPFDAHLARAGVDGDLRDLAAECVDARAVRVRAAGAGAVDRRVASFSGHLDRRRRRARRRASGSGRRARVEVVGGDLEHVARRARAAFRRTFAGGRPHRRHHRRRRHRAAGDRPVDVRARVAAAHEHVVERQAELLGGDDLRRRQRARADVLDAGHHERMPSEPRRIVACAGGPPPPHQICGAQPMPRSRPSRCGSRRRRGRPSRRARPHGRSSASSRLPE